MGLVASQDGGPRPEFFPVPRLPVPPAGPRPRLARGQSDEPAPPALPVASVTPTTPVWTAAPVPVAPLSMPSPAALGFTAAPSGDWTAPLARLESLGLSEFLFKQTPEGGWVFVGQLRTADPGRHHRIAVGPVTTRTEAVRLALAEAERSK